MSRLGHLYHCPVRGGVSALVASLRGAAYHPCHRTSAQGQVVLLLVHVPSGMTRVCSYNTLALQFQGGDGKGSHVIDI